MSLSLNKVRTLVSGNKARFVDHENAVDLDLVYVTDRIIIMGYPATGFASTYRNRRRDVLKFIESRHREKWWIWNLCPLYENAYAPEAMRNRVSRYPFPDHHPPPLPLLPLAVREMTAWLEGDPERIAIIHCKAGKGRSGTLLCSYLLSLPSLPPPPQLDRSYTHSELKDRVAKREDSNDLIMVGAGSQVEGYGVSHDAQHDPVPHETLQVPPVARSTNSSTTTISDCDSLSSVGVTTNSAAYQPINVGDEGKAALADQYDRKDGKVDAVFKLHSSRRMKPTSAGRGVSIPSQRRWCRYINLLFSQRAPRSYHTSAHVKLASVTIYMQPPHGWRKPLASLVLGSNGGEGKAWASVARYDDAYVSELDSLGRGEGLGGSVTWGGVAGTGQFDRQKMFRSCGKMTAVDVPPNLQSDTLTVHHLQPRSVDGNDTIILDRRREFRLKFHLASVPLGWAWLIPAFHLPEPLPSSSPRRHELTFPRSQIDFAIGPGHSIDSIVLCLEEVPDTEPASATRLMTDAEERDFGAADDASEHVREDGE